MYTVILYQVKQTAGDRGITAENMEKSHIDFNEDTSNDNDIIYSMLRSKQCF